MSELKKVYVAKGSGDAHLLRGMLESAGVSAVVRGDDFVPLQGGSLLNMETRSSVWVLEDETYPDAIRIVEEYVRQLQAASGSPAETWRCKTCGEDVESQFTACWSCGSDRPGPGSG